ncbi:MAG: YncE family protein [Nitrososphaerota archaeon]|nr:YncE family protein [Nitrososphaerota archaeon]
MLERIGSVALPSRRTDGYDHADVHQRSGKVYIAHTANDSVEVVDGVRLEHIATISGCTEASGVLCAQEEGLVFAASRGEGKVLVIDAGSDKKVSEVRAGKKPNGLAWDPHRGHLLVADVGDNKARLLDPQSGRALAELALEERPRWSLYEQSLDLFLLNIRDPPGVALISPDSFAVKKFVPISVKGPHGLEAVPGAGRGFVACDGKSLVEVDFANGKELGSVPLSGEPDVLWLNPAKGRIYCAIGEPGVIDVIDTRRLVPLEKLPTEEGAHTLTFDVKRQRLYALMPKSQCAAVFAERSAQDWPGGSAGPTETG